MEEDPSFTWHRNLETGQTVLGVQGELHSATVIEKLKAKFVFLSVGELEKRKGKTDKAGILKASDLAQILKQSGVNSHFELFKNETHGSVIPLNLKELLKYLKD